MSHRAYIKRSTFCFPCLQKEHFHVPWSVLKKEHFSTSHGAYTSTIKGGFSTSHGAYIKRSTSYFPWSICLSMEHFQCPIERASKGAFAISHRAYIFTTSDSIFDNYNTVHLRPYLLMQAVSLVFGILVLQKCVVYIALLFSSIQYSIYIWRHIHTN